jgi:hypothetical protein
MFSLSLSFEQMSYSALLTNGLEDQKDFFYCLSNEKIDKKHMLNLVRRISC